MRYFFLSLLFAANIFSQAPEFHVKITNDSVPVPLSGRVILILNSDTLVDPDIPNPFLPAITFGMDFKNLYRGESLVLNQNNSDGYMSEINKLAGCYSLRAIIDTDTNSCLLMNKGMLYSDKTTFCITPGKPVDININNIYEGIGFNESSNIKLLKLKSVLLSGFYNITVYIESAVILPDSYFEDSTRYYPVVYVFPGWGTTHIEPAQSKFQQTRYGMRGFGMEKIFVFLNQDSRFGFHVFADSDNNGPRANSFITELIPYIENHYRAVKSPKARFLSGQSSGGWAALWLLVNYPDEFGMTWAGSPDPLDFKDFVGHNLYKENANMFYDSLGNLTPAIRSTENPFTNKQWSDLETALGEGGQYQSFEAVFGRRGADNKPEQLFNRVTGEINKEAFEHWKKYDINLLVEKNSEELKNKLDGKINIIVSDNDDFFLDGSVKLFKHTLDSLGIKSNIKFLKDAGHNTWNDELRKEMHSEMDAIFNSK